MTRRNAPALIDPRQEWQRRQGAACSCLGTDDYCPCQNVERPASRMPKREVAARAIYARHPFYLAESTTPMRRDMTISRSFDWDAAPAFYQEECFQIADAVLAALDERQ